MGMRVSTDVIRVVEDLPRSGEYRKRDLSRVKRIAIHHTAGDSQNPEVYAKFHVETRGWPGVGYHFMVGINGEKYLTNELDRASYNVGGMNSSVVGICLMGNFDKTVPTLQQLQAAAELVKALLAVLPNKEVVVVRHGDLGQTACPGAKFPWAEFLELCEYSK